MGENNRIQILPPEVSNKIAAGEVVERPASVVKELVENAIDAGATEITILLKNGGKDLVQVIDNGFGMSEPDLRLAFLRHATSKIRLADDLHAIHTLGFRGEALASIASVSRVEAKSIEAGALMGTSLAIDGGNITASQPVGGAPGTSIAVKTLFHNTPARRKFLRADTTEYRNCLAAANRLALSHPEIQFRLVHNGETIWELASHAMQERICALLGKRLQHMLIAVEDDVGAVKLNGFVGTQDTVRRRGGEQYLFLNGRYILDRSLNHAIVSAYGEILAHGGYPLYVLFLTIDPTRVDVNVHPSKMEVKFADDRLIYSLVRGAVKRVLVSARVVPDLQRSGSSIDQASTEEWRRQEWLLPPSPQAPMGGGDSRPAAAHAFYAPLPSGDDDPAQSSLNFTGTTAAAPEAAATEPPPGTTQSETRGAPSAAVWQIHNRYILTPLRSGLAIIDQHVAHERILYEQALAKFEEAAPASQQLLFPHLLELSAEDAAILREIGDHLKRLGFILKDFGQNTAALEGVPVGLRITNYDTIVQEIIDDFKRGKRAKLEIRDNLAKSYACHTAIRSGEKLSVPEMQALIEQLFRTETPFFCPHGRPVIVKVSLEELDKRFGRI